ncbi:hypothetical protein HEO08_004850, partial [Escherichia coli]|nr:hypothetical protein [Escherichia coli]
CIHLNLMIFTKIIRGFISIKYVTPDERHRGIDAQILEARKKVYREARKRHPERWSKQLRDWELIQAVYLNPEKEAA